MHLIIDLEKNIINVHLGFNSTFYNIYIKNKIQVEKKGKIGYN